MLSFSKRGAGVNTGVVQLTSFQSERRPLWSLPRPGGIYRCALLLSNVASASQSLSSRGSTQLQDYGTRKEGTCDILQEGEVNGVGAMLQR